MSVVVSVEEQGPCVRQLTIEVPRPAVEAETRRVVQDLRKRVRIAGFRKGKVPETVIRQRYGDDIRREVVERLVPRYWQQARAEAELDPLLPPEISGVEAEPGEPLRFNASVEVRPRIELGDLDGFELPDPPVEPTDEEIAEALEAVRRQASEWVKVERPAARGDRLVGHLTRLGSGDGEDAQPDPVRFEVGDETVWEELSLAVTGLAAGGHAEFERRDPGRPEDEPTRFRIAVDAVEERELPALDEELARKVGDFDSLDALRAAVVEGLTRDKRRARLGSRERALIDQLRDRHPVELPPGVVRHETEGMLQEYGEEMARRGIDPQHAEVDWGRLRAEIEPRARERVHGRLLIDAASEKLELEVTPDELERQLALLARARGKPVPAVRRELSDSGRLDDLRRSMLRSKTVARLMGEEAEPAAEADEQPTQASERA